MAEGLATIIRDDAAMIRLLVDRLRAEDAEVAAGAADTLHYLGQRAAELVPQSVDALLAMANRRDWACSSIEAVGSVAGGTDIAVDRLVDLCRGPNLRIQGPGLTALGWFASLPARVVPPLIRVFS